MNGQSVTLLGVGKMGAAFVDRWRAAERPVVLWNRTRSAADALAGDGITVADDPGSAVAQSSVVITMLMDGAALRSVLIDQGAIAAMAPGSVLVDLSTVDVASSEAVAAVADEHGIPYLRGAVSGTPPVVRGGNASLLLSGSDDAYALAKDTLDDITPKHAVVGDAEQARVVKIAVNSMLAVSMQMLAEATALAEASGVPRDTFLDAVDATVLASTYLGYKGAALRNRDYAPTFTTSGMKKDVSLAVDQGAAVGVPLTVSSVVLERLAAAIDAGYGEDDFLSLYCLVQAAAGQPTDLER